MGRLADRILTPFAIIVQGVVVPNAILPQRVPPI